MWIAGGLRLRPTSVKWGKLGCVVYMKRLGKLPQIFGTGEKG